MNTVGISSNALEIQLITSLNLSLNAKLLSTFDLVCCLVTILSLFMQKITQMLTHSALVSILAGVSKHYAHALIIKGEFWNSTLKKVKLSDTTSPIMPSSEN